LTSGEVPQRATRSIKLRRWKSDYAASLRRAIEHPFGQLVTPARAKQHSARPRPHRRSLAPEDTDQHTSGARLKRAAIATSPDREAIDASLDAALRDLETLELKLETAGPTKKADKRRRVPPFPGTGITVAVPPLPSLRPKRK
jgi:hypothetical protein